MARKKSWIDDSNKRLCRAISDNYHKPGVYAVPVSLKDSKFERVYGFCRVSRRESRINPYSKIEKQIRDSGYGGEIIFFHYLDPKKTYIFPA